MRSGDHQIHMRTFGGVVWICWEDLDSLLLSAELGAREKGKHPAACDTIALLRDVLAAAVGRAMPLE